MTSLLTELATRIREELTELQRVIGRARAGWERARMTGDDLYLDSVALNLHGFYSGLERLFELIATRVDRAVPEGANWHQQLLAQMAEEVPGVRPAVISEATRVALEPFRGFRHVVRNVYTHALLSERIADLVGGGAPTFERLQPELLAFARFLESAAGEDAATSA